MNLGIYYCETGGGFSTKSKKCILFQKTHLLNFTFILKILCCSIKQLRYFSFITFLIRIKILYYRIKFFMQRIKNNYRVRILVSCDWVWSDSKFTDDSSSDQKWLRFKKQTFICLSADPGFHTGLSTSSYTHIHHMLDWIKHFANWFLLQNTTISDSSNAFKKWSWLDLSKFSFELLSFYLEMTLCPLDI